MYLHTARYAMTMCYGPAAKTPVKHAYSAVSHTFHNLYRIAYHTFFTFSTAIFLFSTTARGCKLTSEEVILFDVSLAIFTL